MNSLARRTQPVALRQLASLAALFAQSLTAAQRQPCQPAPVQRLFLTIPEAAAYSGLSSAFLRKLVATGKLKTFDRPMKVRRADIDNLAGLAELAESSQKLTAAAKEMRGAIAARRGGRA